MCFLAVVPVWHKPETGRRDWAGGLWLVYSTHSASSVWFRAQIRGPCAGCLIQPAAFRPCRLSDAGGRAFCAIDGAKSGVRLAERSSRCFLFFSFFFPSPFLSFIRWGKGSDQNMAELAERAAPAAPWRMASFDRAEADAAGRVVAGKWLMRWRGTDSEVAPRCSAASTLPHLLSVVKGRAKPETQLKRRPGSQMPFVCLLPLFSPPAFFQKSFLDPAPVSARSRARLRTLGSLTLSIKMKRSIVSAN
jgi:hypothetical protein